MTLSLFDFTLRFAGMELFESAASAGFLGWSKSQP